MESEVVALVVGPEPSAAPDMMAVGLFEGKIKGSGMAVYVVRIVVKVGDSDWWKRLCAYCRARPKTEAWRDIDYTAISSCQQ